MNWIISAFNLTSACFIPMWGQIADILGRHVAVEMALLMMMIGSALCTSAPLNTFPLLILGRALQGLACAGINVCCRVILADKVSRKNPREQFSHYFRIFREFCGLSFEQMSFNSGNISWDSDCCSHEAILTPSSSSERVFQKL